MKNFKSHILASAAAILTACATATPYQAAAKMGASGYSQSQIESNRYTVSFSGNSLTDQETVETYLLYRAAELAVENGYDYFTVAEKDTQAKKRLVNMGPSMGYGGGYGFNNSFYPGFNCNYDFFAPRYGWRSGLSPYGRRDVFARHSLARSGFYDPFFGPSFGSRFGAGYYDPFYNRFDYREVTKFKANAQVRMGHGMKPSGDNSFNAREVMANLGPKVTFPEIKEG
ncbi:MAG: hypothetical protein V3U82_04315 [Robiginitomaculum sp.]